MLYKIISKIIRIAAKKELEKRAKTKLPSVKVLGNLFFETPELVIGNNVVLWPGVSFAGKGKIIIEDGVKIGTDTIIYANEEVIIKKNTIIAAFTYVIDCDHGMRLNKPIKNQPLISIPITIGKDCWLGANTVILKGSEIGDGTVIGAKSLVNGKIENNSIAVGIPAKTINKRK